MKYFMSSVRVEKKSSFLYISRMVIFVGTRSGRVIVGGEWRGMESYPLLNGHRVSVGDNEKVLEMEGGHGYTAM